MSEPNNTILLIDSHALIHRAYHAFPATLTTEDGQPVNAAYGFTSLLLQILQQFQPEYVICVFDGKGKTFRHEQFAAYKAHRPETDEALKSQFPVVHDIVDSLSIPRFIQEGYEADDIIGSFTRSDELKGLHKIIVTGDKDLLQLVSEETSIYLAGSNIKKSEQLDPEGVAAKLGFTAEYLTDYKGLRGDSSDNIPGVKGIGDKTATQLITAYGHLEEIYTHIDEIKGAVQKKLISGKEDAFLSRDLATIVTDLNLSLTRSDAKVSDYDYESAKSLFQKLRFKSLISRLPKNDQITDMQESFLLDTAVDAVDYSIVDGSTREAFKKAFTAASTVSVLMTRTDPLNIFAPLASAAVGIDGDVYLIPDVAADKEVSAILTGLKDKTVNTYRAKDLFHCVRQLGIKELSIGADLLLLAHITQAGTGSTELDTIAFNRAGIVINDQDSPETVLVKHVKTVMALAHDFIQDLASSGTPRGSMFSAEYLYREIELPLAPVLARMEEYGIGLDAEQLSAFKQELLESMARIEDAVYEEAGMKFNLGSPRQLGEVLFEKMGLPGGSKSKSGQYSTNERVLSKLVESFPVVAKILEYREVSKLQSTYTDALIEQKDPDTGRIHTNYNQVGAATGRLSSNNPNLQNIPTSTDLGRRIKDAFVAAEGKILLAVDYSQQELRLLAHLSGEPALVKAFNEEVDIHALTASRLFGMDVTAVGPDERRVGKTVNFGVIYGMSAFGLSDRLRIDRNTAREFIDGFFAGYPEVDRYFTELKHQALTDGYVSTLFGRKKNTEALRSGNWQAKAAIERELVNYPLQGSAADMMKLAMNRADALIREKYSDFATMNLQIHDELVFELDTDDRNDPRLLAFARDVHAVMSQVVALKVPVALDFEVGTSLGGLESLSGL
ncbi:MAG: DNA polymerase I, thermostable [candidate division WS6 bacterium OLB20]|uniref:DNA polymerase I n=1 Tax=candidate division WS6 bacterium OLB20 TaxID=1617426 RepID=A0A136LYK3_9BACT|nr:MAG: DNA polymerase I, thermostable [candidate division WS6 bacterium OLB20]